MKFNGYLVLIASVLCFCPLALASEDSPSPFPDDFYISDLPELPPLEDFPPLEVETATPVTPMNIEEETPPPPPSSIQDEPVAEESINIPLTEDVAAPNNDAEPIESEEPEPIFQTKPNQSDDVKNEPPVISANQSLTDNLKKNEKANFIEGTWVEKLTSINPLTALGSASTKTQEESDDDDDLTQLVKNSRAKNKDGKSNASVFDISGVMLKMNLNQVERTMANRGFQKINAEYTIPNFIKWRNEEDCRIQGITGYERMQSCVKTLAKKAGHEYIFHIKYAKFDSKEEIDVYLTSNFTENKVHKIEYRSRIAAITGNSPKAVYIRNLKIYDFWKKINQKFGDPDNKKNVTWGLGGNKPFLKAATGYLLLDDPMFREMDYTRMSREDKRYIHSDYYNF
ncbi:MAG: hypothetical protein E7004_00900 [Alphaproteobacteria bacterium]|nr:hypothetical protein [Alphaproteobacteria bacterium]